MPITDVEALADDTRGQPDFLRKHLFIADAREAQINCLADMIEEHLDVEVILGLIGTASRGAGR